MTNDFLVRIEEISLLDEGDFLAHGGEELHFGAVVSDVVHLFASGSREAITHLAHSIISHHTAA